MTEIWVDTAELVAPQWIVDVIDDTAKMAWIEAGLIADAGFEKVHPRGKDGKFIKKGVVGAVLYDILKKASHVGNIHFNDLKSSEKDDFVHQVIGLTPAEWHNFTDDQQSNVADAVDAALEDGVPGSATAATHLDELADADVIDVTPAEEVFKPETKLPEAPKAKSKETPFKILEDTGKNGDGYAAPGLWGKYGAAGVMIEATDDQGEKRYLMVQRGPIVSSNKGKWQLAGGALNSKETPEQGAAREIFEEIGAPQEYLATMEKVGTHAIEVPIEGKDPWVYSNIAARAPTMFDPKIDGTETGDAKWLTKAEILELADSGKLHPALMKNIDAVFGLYDGGESDEVTAPKADVDDIIPDAPVATLDVTPPPGKTIVTKATPVKMTHTLIHAKHTPGETIGVTKVPVGTVHVKWNGSQYEVELRKNGSLVTKTNVKKSALYAYLATNFPNADWTKSGKVDVVVDAPSVKAVVEQTAPSIEPTISKPITPANVEQKLNMTGWKQVSGQAGSNKGGLFEAPDGTRYYVKSQKSASHAKNEVLAAALYQAAGVDVPEVRHVADGTGPTGWSNVTASKFITGKSASKKLLNDPDFRSQVYDGFVVDVWIANWDTVGLGYDNIVDVNGKPLRIDAGGSLLYRAQGAPKGSWFGSTPIELGSLKDASINPQAAKVFGGISVDEERESAKHLLGITDAQIDQLVADAGMDKSLADTLKARRAFILKKYGLDSQNIDTPTKLPPPGPPTPVIDITPKVGPVGSGLPSIGSSSPHSDMIDLSISTGKVHVGDVIATGKAKQFPNAEYRAVIAVDSSGEDYVKYEYRTGIHSGDVSDWKPMDIYSQVKAADNAQKIGVVWVPNTDDGDVPSAPATVSDLKKPVIVQQVDDMTPEKWNSLSPSDQMIFVDKIYSNDESIPPEQLVKQLEANIDPNNSPSPGPATITPAPIATWKGIVDGAMDGEIVAWAPDNQGYQVVYDANDDAFDVQSAGVTIAMYTPDEVAAGILNIDYDNVNWSTGAMPSTATTSTPKSGIGHLSASAKWGFYSEFKSTKVSPSWSGAKIYNSMQGTKATLAGNPHIAALTDEQMLDILDEQLKIASPYGKYAQDATPFKDKVLEWLKTPNGKKAALAAKSGGWASAHVSIPTSKGGKKAAKKLSSTSPPFHKLSATDIIGNATVADVNDTFTQDLKTKIYNAVKASPQGNSVKSPPAELYATIHKVAKANTLSQAEVLAVMDIETQKKYGKVSHTYTGSVKQWLDTSNGNKTAQEINAGTYVAPAKKAKKKNVSYGSSTYGSSYGGVMAHAADKPYDQKVQVVSHNIEPLNLTKSPSNFPVISTSEAATQWKTWTSANPLTSSQQSSLKYYTSNAGYSAMNGYLRGKKGATDATQKHIHDAQAGMRVSQKDIVLHRGSSHFPGWQSYDEIKKREGTVWQEPAYFSASVGGKSAFGGSIAFIVEAPAGTPMVYVKSFSHYGGENEMLLAAGLKYHIISVENKGSSTTSGSKITVRLRIVPDTTVAANEVP